MVVRPLISQPLLSSQLPNIKTAVEQLILKIWSSNSRWSFLTISEKQQLTEIANFAGYGGKKTVSIGELYFYLFIITIIDCI